MWNSCSPCAMGLLRGLLGPSGVWIEWHELASELRKPKKLHAGEGSSSSSSQPEASSAQLTNKRLPQVFQQLLGLGDRTQHVFVTAEARELGPRMPPDRVDDRAEVAGESAF